MMTKSQDVLKALSKSKRLKDSDVTITMLGDDESPCVVSEYMSTGCVALDSIMGGGLPVGRLTEIYGDNSTGKSLIAAQVAAIAQECGILVQYIDTESAVSRDIMIKVGVKIDDLMYSAPDTMEQVFALMEDTIMEKKALYPDDHLLIIWDSIAATSTDSEMEADTGKSTMGIHARMMSQGLRKLARLIAKEKVCALFLNQTREKIGVMFGDNTATFGGKAVGFYASVRIQLKIGNKIRDANKHVLGINSRAVCTKNKVAEPFHSAELPIYFGHGIDDPLASFMYLKEAGLMTSKGNKYTLGELEFSRAGWAKIYDDYYDDIANLVLSNTLVDADETEEQ
jgi:recombination protein RecA